MKNIYLISVIVLTLLYSIGCEQDVGKRINCICLIDYSGSLSEETLNKYIDIICNDITSNLSRYDKLTVLPIDEGAKIEAVKLINIDFTEEKFYSHSFGFTHAEDSIRNRISLFVEKQKPLISQELKIQKEVRSKYTSKTDIVSAIEQAANLLENNQENEFIDEIGRFISGKKKIGSENVIILFSDMIHESDEWNFNKPDGCSDGERERILNFLEKKEKIPQLDEVKIFVNGRTGRSNKQIENIQKFWKEFFIKSRAQLIKYDYDTGNEIVKHLKNTH